jgi:hypothetical protein
MTYAPTHPVDVPPYQVQDLISTVVDDFGQSTAMPFHCTAFSSMKQGSNLGMCTFDVPRPWVRDCSQILPVFVKNDHPGSEIYVGCSNGELIRFALQADDPSKVSQTLHFLAKHFLTSLVSWNRTTYSRVRRSPTVNPSMKLFLFLAFPGHTSYPVPQYILSSQLTGPPTHKIDSTDRTLHFYTMPSLDPVSLNIVKPIRHVSTFAVDHRDLQRPQASFSNPSAIDTVNFCIIKRSSIAMYTMRERLSYLKVNEFPSRCSSPR